MDALFVAASRPASHLRVSAQLADQLGCELVVLCSRRAKSAEFAQVVSEWPTLRWTALDIPDGYAHRVLNFSTSMIDEVKAHRLGDLSLKRNLGLLFARLLGWRSILFLDDDIVSIDEGTVRDASAALSRFTAVGFPVHHFPDNSVVCHANRLAGGRQDVFVSGSALLVRPGDSTFFPEIYNEDWFFMFDDLSRRGVASTGQAKQLPYEPFADPRRATEEEFGDLLAEGLVGLLHEQIPFSAALEAGYWQEFLRRRRQFIERSVQRLEEATDIAQQPAAMVALRAAEARRVDITPASCAAYLRTWRADQARWAQSVDALHRLRNFMAAAQFLDLSDRIVTPDAYRRRKAVQMSISSSSHESSGRVATAFSIDPSARVAETAQLGAPYRYLLEGGWERLDRPTTVEALCDIGHFCVVGEEVVLGERTILDNYTLVAGGASVGSRVVVTHRASIGERAEVGDGCVIGGLICELSKIGRACRVFGDLIHRQLDPTLPWDAADSTEGSPILEEGSFVGWGATVVGGVTVGRAAYVCAGATVTRDVPAGHIVTGINEVHRPEDWKGSLGKSQFFFVPAQPDGARAPGTSNAARQT